MYVCCTAIGGWDGSGTAVVGASFAIAGRSVRSLVQGDSGFRTVFGVVGGRSGGHVSVCEFVDIIYIPYRSYGPAGVFVIRVHERREDPVSI